MTMEMKVATDLENEMVGDIFSCKVQIGLV